MKFDLMHHGVSSTIFKILIIIPLLMIGSSCIPSVEPISFDVSEVTISHDFQVGEDKIPVPVSVTDKFSAHDQRITLCYRLKTNAWLNITYHWYRENILEASHSVTITQGRFCTFIVPKTDQGFAPGEWSVEIMLHDLVLKHATFTIVDNPSSG